MKKFKSKLFLFKSYIYRFLMFDCKICLTPLTYLLLSFHKCGIGFYYHGDYIIRLWPWRRKDKKLKYISLGFTGTGEFGDALFPDLAAIDKMWNDYFESCRPKITEESLGPNDEPA